MSSPPSALAISSFSCVDNPQALSSLLSMAPDKNWTTMWCKSPSSPKSPAQLPPKQLTSPLLPSFPPSSAPRPASTTSSAERAADGCPSPISYWDQPNRTDWDFDNTITCDSTGCSYNTKKNPRTAKWAITVAEFDDCSYEEYEDTLFLCGQCNMKCLKKVNGSKIKSKMPIKRFLTQRKSEDSSDSFAADALDLPLPPPTAADFPELPRAAPTPKMTKAKKAMARKINTLLLADVKGKAPATAPSTRVKAANAKPPASAAQPATPVPPCERVACDTEFAKPPSRVPSPPGIVPIPVSLRDDVFPPSPQLSGSVTPIMAMASVRAEHAVRCSHETDECSICRLGITCCKCCSLCAAPAARRMRCTKCLHWACDLDQSNECCMCSTLWVPQGIFDLPTKTPLRLRGGAGSNKEWSDGSSVHTAQEDSTVKIQVSPPTQESLEEIDAFSHTSTAKPPAARQGKRSHPKSGQSSGDPSRPPSAASDLISVMETILPGPPQTIPPLAHEYQWVKPPTDPQLVPGYIHAAHKEKVLLLDDDDATHFIKRGKVDINAISEELDILLSGDSSWKTIYHAITDLFQFDSIEGSKEDFICLLIGLARSWDSDAKCKPAEVLKALINDASTLVKTEGELQVAQTALSRICSERNQAMTDVKKMVDTIDRVRKEQNHLRSAMEEIVASGGSAPSHAQFEGLQAEVETLKNENTQYFTLSHGS
ncbi:hypothetical protein AX14_006582 [Amanita brunnescens Koide BX004]|nr:hypothetical protein AX14_006582 [Amanita brunnescens Koide BX004]